MNFDQQQFSFDKQSNESFEMATSFYHNVPIKSNQIRVFALRNIDFGAKNVIFTLIATKITISLKGLKIHP